MAKQLRLGTLGLLLLAGAFSAAPLCAAPSLGKLTGVVVDPIGTPQMGASISVVAEDVRGSAAVQLLTNDRGTFTTDRLLPGFYSVRVTLAGFLPAVERHVRIESSLTTLVRIELNSLLTSLERLRRKPNQQVEADDWAWVLRTSAATRPILRYSDGEVVLAEDTTSTEAAKKQSPHGRIELTSGARRPGSVSNLADAPATSFAYEQRVGHDGRLVMAGNVSYERSAAAGFSTTWLPTGDPNNGPRTTMVLRQSNLGPNGPTFRGVRLQHEDEVDLGDHFAVRYGAEYILVGLGTSTSSLRPQAEFVWKLSPDWRASFTVASRPWSSVAPAPTALESAVNQLDAFPAVLLRNGRPVLAGGWHEEIAVEHQLGPSTSIVASVFRDRSSDTAVFGRGSVPNPDFFQDYYSDAFAYDGGSLSHLGTRIAYRQKFADDTEATLVYALAGALASQGFEPGLELRDMLHTRGVHSLAARVSTRLSKTHTTLAASYKWMSDPVVSRQDPFGEVTYQLDPFLNLSLRQPLPAFLFPVRVEAQADFRNLLAQGYVPVNIGEGHVLLMPAYRSFRGGFSFQF